MTVYRVHPAGDAGPNDGRVFPLSPGTHFDKVDDDPADDGSSFVKYLAPGANAFWLSPADLAAIPAAATILDVQVQWREAGSGISGSTAQAGLLLADGVSYPGPVRALSSDGSYTTFVEDFPLDPSSGSPWTLARLQDFFLSHQQLAVVLSIPQPHLTQMVLLVTVADPPVRPGASASSLSGSASGASQAGSAKAAPLGPSGSGASLSGAASGQPLKPSGTGQSLAAAAGAASRSGSAAPSGAPGKPTASAAALGPSASAVSLGPTASAAVLIPSGAGS